MQTYLEVKGQKFWEITVSGKNHTVRYGKVGTDGRESVKDFDSEELAQKDAEKLILSKKKKGYVEVEAPEKIDVEQLSELLGNQPLSEDEKDKLKLLKTMPFNEFQINFWDRQIRKLLRETVHQTKTRTEYTENGRKHFSPYFEKIAVWNSPDMDKRIIRDEENYIKKIIYSINGIEIFHLRNSGYVNQNAGKPLNFFAHFEYLFGSKISIVSGMRELLEKLPRFCVETLDLMQVKEQKANKSQKIKQVAENNIDLVITNLMKQLGFPYALEETKTASLLKIKAHNDYYLEFSLPHKTFIKRIDNIEPTIKLVEQALNQIDIPIFLGKKQTDVSWNRSSTYWISNSFSTTRYATERFWEKRWQDYMAKTLVKNNQDISFDLEEMANFEHKDFITYVEVENNKVEYISYKLKANRNIYIYLQGSDWMSIKGFSQNRIYPKFAGTLKPDDFQAFFDGFLACYESGLIECESAIQKSVAPLLAETNKRDKAEQDLKEAMVKIGRKYALDLMEPKYIYPIYLDIKVKSKQVLCLCLKYSNYESHIAHISAIINLVEQTMNEAKIPFKIVNMQARRCNVNWKQG